MKSTRIRRPRALSSVLAALGTLQPRALGLLIRVDFIDSLSNYYLLSSQFESSGVVCKVVSPFPLPTGADFSDVPVTIEVPAGANDGYARVFSMPNFFPFLFQVIDDDIDEYEQSFAIVAELGPDVSDRIACFQLQAGDSGCFGRRGATEIRITDNDRKYFFILISCFCSTNIIVHQSVCCMHVLLFTFPL